jgi:hypothetical protein
VLGFGGNGGSCFRDWNERGGSGGSKAWEGEARTVLRIEEWGNIGYHWLGFHGRVKNWMGQGVAKMRLVSKQFFVENGKGARHAVVRARTEDMFYSAAKHTTAEAAGVGTVKGCKRVNGEVVGSAR